MSPPDSGPATGGLWPCVSLTALPETSSHQSGEIPGSRGHYRSPDDVLGLQRIGFNSHVLAPGQEHAPYHAHAAEELFIVRYGTCCVRLDGRIHRLQPLDALLVPGGIGHSVFNDGPTACDVWMVVPLSAPLQPTRLTPPAGDPVAGRPPQALSLRDVIRQGGRLALSEGLGSTRLQADVLVLAAGESVDVPPGPRERLLVAINGRGALLAEMGEQALQAGDGLKLDDGRLRLSAPKGPVSVLLLGVRDVTGAGPLGASAR